MTIVNSNENEKLFKELYHKYYNKIYNYIFRYTFNKEISEDIASNTFFKLIYNCKGYRCFFYLLLR